jgi:hypothetical protein
MINCNSESKTFNFITCYFNNGTQSANSLAGIKLIRVKISIDIGISNN